MSRIRRKRLYFPALLILAVVVLLLVWISISTYRNFNRDREQALGYVYRQGIVLMHTMESGVRATLMTPQWDETLVSRIIQETATYEGIAYIYLVDRDGRVLFRTSGMSETAEPIWLPKLTDISPVRSRVRILPDETKVYEMAKDFVPVPHTGETAGAAGVLVTYPGLARYRLVDPVIVLGMTMGAFESARQADLNHAMIMGGIVIALGMGALFFILVIQNYYLVDRKLEKNKDYMKQVEERARQAEKLAVVGKLASGVAHEIRNPLSSIRGFAQYLSRLLADRPREKEYADIMVKEVDRINGVVSDLLTLSRPSVPELSPADIEELAGHALRLVEDDARVRNIKLHREIPPHVKKVHLDVNQMIQVLLNLLLNAIQAIGSGGNITIGADHGKQSENILLRIEDDGPGIPPEIGEKIFDPFVTTREGGNGLGLAIVRTIVENHGGGVRVESPPAGLAKGSRFVIELPMADE